MRLLRQVLPAFVIALVSILITLGGLGLSLVEGGMAAPERIQSPTISPLPATFTPPAVLPDPVTVTPQMTTPTPSATPSATASETPPPTPPACPPPQGYVPYTVKAGDTLTALASRHQVTVATLRQANCLLVDSLVAGSILYVPPLPTSTPVPCGAPAGWVAYVVQAGDTLYRLSQAYGVTVPQLQAANCMGSSTLLRTGQSLFVPPWAPRTPTPTTPRTATPTSTTPASPTPENDWTATPVNTLIPVPSETEEIPPPPLP